MLKYYSKPRKKAAHPEARLQKTFWREIEGVEFRYDAETGKFWRWFVGGSGENGTQPARWKEVALPTKGSGGYRKIRIGGKRLQASRVAWFMVYQVWPTLEIDHINGVKDDNRFSNLREATHAQNALNRGLFPNNKTGFKGVHKQGNKFIAQARVNGKPSYLGSFDSPEEAHQAYLQVAKEHYGEFARLT